MGRPLKYATAKEANENNLYSKQGGPVTGLTLEEFIDLSTQKCNICGCDPGEKLITSRTDDRHVLMWNFIEYSSKGPKVWLPLCRMCRLMYRHFDIDALVRHCARIMAKRMHDKRRK